MEKEKTDIENVDLGLKIVSPREALFSDLKRRTENSIKDLENEMIVQRAVLNMCLVELKFIELDNAQAR